jgi:GDP-6-deoxy-D-talose 4-dehydrogenase
MPTTSTILITGSSGRLGKILVEILSKEFSVVTLSRSDKEATIYQDINTLTVKQINKIYTDHSISVVVHCAGITSPSKESDILFNAFSFTKFLTNKRIRHIVFGSVAEYGSQKGSITEYDCEKPFTLYGLSKVLQKKTAEFHKEYKRQDIIYLRASNILMPHMQSTSLIETIGSIVGKNKKVFSIRNEAISRDFIDVRDVIQLVKDIIIADHPSFIYNVCAGKQTNYKTLISLLKLIYTKKNIVPFPTCTITHENELYCRGSYSREKADKELSWKPHYSLEQSLSWIVEQRYG